MTQRAQTRKKNKPKMPPRRGRYTTLAVVKKVKGQAGWVWCFWETARSSPKARSMPARSTFQ